MVISAIYSFMVALQSPDGRQIRAVQRDCERVSGFLGAVESSYAAQGKAFL